MLKASSSVRTGSPQTLAHGGGSAQRAQGAQPAQQARRQQTQSAERKQEVRQQRTEQTQDRAQVRISRSQEEQRQSQQVQSRRDQDKSAQRAQGDQVRQQQGRGGVVDTIA